MASRRGQFVPFGIAFCGSATWKKDRNAEMENALLVGLSRQMVLRRQMDVLANNMANVNTAGYKRDKVQFEEHLMPIARMSDARGQDSRLSFVIDPSMYRDFEAGGMEQTGNELDVAISGDAWFAVQTPEGERYTRNGQFKLNANGDLVAASGDPVLGEGGPINFGPDENGIEIASDGTISTNLGQRGKLRLVQFADNGTLRKEGALLFSSDTAPGAADDAKVAQGMIERSNVQPVLELTRILETVRAYEGVSKALEQTAKLRSDAISRLGGAEG